MLPRYAVRTQADARYCCVWDTGKNRVATYTEEAGVERAYIDLGFANALEIALRLNAENASDKSE